MNFHVSIAINEDVFPFFNEYYKTYKFDAIQIKYGDFIAIDNLNLEINDGEFFTFFPKIFRKFLKLACQSYV